MYKLFGIPGRCTPNASPLCCCSHPPICLTTVAEVVYQDFVDTPILKSYSTLLMGVAPCDTRALLLAAAEHVTVVKPSVPN
jgi:hypothetical protein